jgi:predicted AAA+ superfamily ATPase
MGIRASANKGDLKPWPDVLDPSQDGKSAPSLWEVALGQAPEIYNDPAEFFKRTHFTSQLTNTLEGVANRMKGKTGNRQASVFVLPNVVMLASRYGGGKTHTLISLFHAFSNPESIGPFNEKLATLIESLKDVQVVSLDADSKNLVPHPLEPHTIENFHISTIWGMLAYRVGEYGKLKHLDSGHKPVPDTDSLKELLRGKRLLILMDEIVKYAFNMQRSEETKDYGEKVVTFVENLAKAVEDTESVLVVAVQADYRKGAETAGPISITDFAPDAQYKEQAERIIQALRRVSPAIITPVSSDDIVQVLKKRIFEEIPQEVAGQIQSQFHSIYREHQDVFGVEGKWDFVTSARLLSIRDTYPFHPKYVEMLTDFVNRNKDLQRTRDAVNITRKVVRNLLRSDLDPLAIMPGHIQLKIREIRDNTVTETYAKDFDQIINKDIVTREGSLGNVKFCSKPDIAEIIANDVLLKTFTYETFKEALQVFPDLTDVALMVYEPELFQMNEATPADIQDSLKEMVSLDHFMSDKGRYWFSPYRSVKEIVDKMAETIVKEEKLKLYSRLSDIASSIVNVSTSKNRTYEPTVFKNPKTTIVSPGFDLTQDISVPDDDKMKIVVFVKEPVSNEDLERVLLSSQGSRRLRINTTIAIYPDPNKKIDDLLPFIAKTMAASQVMENLKEYYADQEVRSLQQRKLNAYTDENELHAKEGLLSTLTRIAYPTTGPAIKTVDAQKGPSLVEQVERALNSASTQYKIRQKIDFDDLKEYLKGNFSIDLVEGVKPIEFRYIYDELFLAKPEGPFVARNQIEDAIREGLRNLDIAVQQEGKLYWKKIDSAGADEPSSISDRAEILPYRLAAGEFVKMLRKIEGKRKDSQGNVVEVRFFVKVLDEERPLDMILSQPDFERILKENLVLRKETVLREGFDLAMDQSFVTVKPIAPFAVQFQVDRIGDFSETVTLHVDNGSIKPPSSKPPFRGTWSITAPAKPGTYTMVMTAKSASLTRTFQFNLVVESEYRVLETESLDSTHEGGELLEIRPYSIPVFKVAADTLEKLGVEGKSKAKVTVGSLVVFESSELHPSICSFLLQRFEEFKERYNTLQTFDMMRTFDYSGSMELTKPLRLDQRSISNLAMLNKKARFLVQLQG